MEIKEDFCIRVAYFISSIFFSLLWWFDYCEYGFGKILAVRPGRLVEYITTKDDTMFIRVYNKVYWLTILVEHKSFIYRIFICLFVFVWSLINFHLHINERYIDICKRCWFEDFAEISIRQINRWNYDFCIDGIRNLCRWMEIY